MERLKKLQLSLRWFYSQNLTLTKVTDFSINFLVLHYNFWRNLLQVNFLGCRSIEQTIKTEVELRMTRTNKHHLSVSQV